MSAVEQPIQESSTFSSVGGRLCLDFVNTLAHRLLPDPDEMLLAYSDLVSWGRHCSAITQDQAGVLYRKAADLPNEAQRAFQQALVLREAAFGIFSSLIEKRTVSESSIKTVQDFFTQAVSRMTLNEEQQTFQWTVAPRDLELDSLSWMVAHSVVQVLTSGEYNHVKQCEGVQDCGFLFYDSSKNRTRRWCSMGSCGSRVKMRALYVRRKQHPDRA